MTAIIRASNDMMDPEMDMLDPHSKSLIHKGAERINRIRIPLIIRVRYMDFLLSIFILKILSLPPCRPENLTAINSVGKCYASGVRGERDLWPGSRGRYKGFHG